MLFVVIVEEDPTDYGCLTNDNNALHRLNDRFQRKSFPIMIRDMAYIYLSSHRLYEMAFANVSCHNPTIPETV